MGLLHSYYPLGGDIPGYVANEMPTLEILAKFTVGCVAILAVARFCIQMHNPRISLVEQSTAMWFVLSGCIHMGMEGEFHSISKEMTC